MTLSGYTTWIALAALGVSIGGVIRQVRRDRRVAVKSSAAFVIVRLIDDHGTYWWKVENHGPDTAWLKALNVVPIDAPPEAEHGTGDDPNEPTAADPPLHDARLLPAILAPHSHVFLRADPGDVPPPYRAMVWDSDKVTGRRFRQRAFSRPVAPEPPP